MELTQAQRERIDKGADLLDEKEPNWFTRINGDTLDINSFNLCVVCQVFGDFYSGLADLGLGLAGKLPEREASEYGFYPHKAESDDELDLPHDEAVEAGKELAAAKTAYWMVLVTKRLEGVK